MKKLKSILSNVLEINEDAITLDTSPDNTESWDSFNALLLVTELENCYKLKFTMDEVTSVKCFGDIVCILKKKGAVLDDG